MVVSDNSVYAQLTKLVGPKAIVKTAHELGIRSELDPYFSIGLGAVAVNPLDMTRAYATFANRGVRVDGSVTGDRPRVVEQVEFARTGPGHREPARRQGRDDDGRGRPPHLDPAEASSTREPATRAALPDRPVAGKTGTTDNYGDAWFVGYTPQLAVAVWVGYPDKLQPMLTEFGGKPVAGGTLPAEIWHAFMTAADKQLQARPGAVPADAVHPGPGQADRLARRLVQARQRLLPRHAGRRLLRRARPVDARRSATRTRSRCRSSSARRSTRRTRLLAQQPLGSELIGVPAKAGKHPGLRHQAGAAQRLPLRQRDRAALRHPARSALRPAAEPRRVERRRRPAQRLQALKAKTTITYDKGSPGAVLEQTPEPGVAAGRGLKVDAGRGPRDAQREPLTT